MDDRTRGALADVRVLDLGTFLAAPFSGTLLAEFGADVIKVEQPGLGDSLRGLGEQVDGLGLFWLQEARNKRAITCDLRKPEGRQIVLDLVAHGYDVVLENFRPGTLERWELGFDDLTKANPGVILARVSGFGQTGPYQHKPGFGRIAHAFGGLTYLAGFPDRPPANPGSTTIADYVAGLFTTVGVLVAREHRARTGRGQVIDVALYEALFRVLDSLAITYAVTGKVREREGTGTPLAAPHNHYPTSDGWLAIACTNDRIFARLAMAMHRPELADDGRFATAAARVAHRDELDAIVAEWTGGHSSTALLERLDAAEVPSSRINSIADAFADSHFQARRTLIEVEHASLGTVRVPTVIPRLSETPGMVETLGPGLGEHTDTVLRDVLGYAAERVAALRAGGVL